MARARASHTAWRELISARLDRPLTRAETRSLATHLRACAACRQVDRDYREQRALLRALPLRPAPRDLWPRTSAALDREVARGSYRRGQLWRGLFLDSRLSGAARRAAAPSAALVTTLAALGVIAALGVTQLLPTVEPLPPSTPGQATPFAVAPQPLAFIGNEATDLYVYQTDVHHVCPPTAPDCEVDDDIVRTAVNLPSSVRARNVALSPSGDALVLVGRDSNRDVIAVVMLEPRGGDQPTQPGGSNPTPLATPPGSAAPDGSGQPSGSDGPPVTPASAQPEPTLATPPASTVPGFRVVAILENVVSAGAPPAWSGSGEMLAFSAMPADGSQGPDVYVWSPSDAVARPITSDHGSYFASWSGERIVASRVVAKPGAGEQRLSTIVIDPVTAEERAVGGPGLWLPVVNPEGSYAVAWRGELDLAGGLALPQTGTLYMIDWAAIDPFALGSEPVATPAPTAEPPATPALPSEAPTPSPTAAPPSAEPTAEATETAPAPTADASTGATSPPETATPAPTETPAAPAITEQPTAPLPAGSIALDLGRDTISAPVVDWQVRWSVDGQVLGIWIADAQGSSWGRLTVLAVDPDTNLLGTADPLLSPALARRGFSLGLSRVAWVAPSEDNPDGELRIRTWGDDGVGGLLLVPSRLEEVLPAF